MKRSFVLSVMYITLAAALSACGGGGGGGGGFFLPPAQGSGVLTGTMTAQYSNAQNWNDYVKASDTATACDGTETGGYSACIHGGERKAVPVTGKTACTGLTAADALDAFEWTCDASTNPVQMVSMRLKDGKNLSDLIDFSTPAWKPNSVTVYDGGTAYLATNSSAWWTNPMQVDNDGMTSGEMDVAGTIYLVTADATGTYVMGADKIALVIKPGATLSGPGTGKDIIANVGTRNVWIEGSINALNDYHGVFWFGVNFSVMRNLKADNANGGMSDVGVHLEGSSNNSLTSVSTANNRTSGVFLSGSSDNNSLTGITASNNVFMGVAIYTSSSNTLSDVTAANNGDRGVYLNSSSNNSLKDVSASNNAMIGVFLDASSSNNTLSGVTAANNGDSGIYLNSSSSNTLMDISASNNTSYGVLVFNGSANKLSGVIAANNGSYGVYLSGSSGNRLTSISAANNGINGVYLYNSSRNNILTSVTALNNASYGVDIDTSSNNVLSNVSSANNGFDGIRMLNAGSSDNFLSNVTAANNAIAGIRMVSAGSGVFSNISTANNGTGVYLSSSSSNIFTGLLKVGSNIVNCTVSGGTNPGLVTVTCANEAPSDADLTLGIALGSSLVGKVYTDGINGSDTGSAVAYPADPATFDWGVFENAFRGWGKDGTFGAATSRDRWTSGVGAIWDWSISVNDLGDPGPNGTLGDADDEPAILNVLSVPTGADTHTHIWYLAVPPFNQGDCDTKAPGSVFNVNKCENTFLKNAIETAEDGIGNDNLLCESNETCLFTPNIGSYQGHGNLVSAGAFTDGTITGVTLMKYETNGR